MGETNLNFADSGIHQMSWICGHKSDSNAIFTYLATNGASPPRTGLVVFKHAIIHHHHNFKLPQFTHWTSVFHQSGDLRCQLVGLSCQPQFLQQNMEGPQMFKFQIPPESPIEMSRRGSQKRTERYELRAIHSSARKRPALHWNAQMANTHTVYQSRYVHHSRECVNRCWNGCLHLPSYLA